MGKRQPHRKSSGLQLNAPTRPPEWLPDWRDPSAYPDPKATPGDQWAWEFLRRNPKYQHEYRTAEQSNDAATWESMIESWGFGGGCLPVNPSSNNWEMMAYIDQGHGGTTKKISMGAPTLESAFVRELDPAGEALKRNEVGIVFDLSFPIAPQIERIKTHLLRAQRGPRGSKFRDMRARVDLYQTYLRLLDAEATGVTIARIAKLLYDHKSADLARRTVETQLVAAKKIRDADYQLLPLIS